MARALGTCLQRTNLCALQACASNVQICARAFNVQICAQYKRQHKRMDEKFIWKVMRQILLALHTCHHRDEVILHRDLKVTCFS